jgi:branched-chain amino acid transport system substrate-binding protein
MNDLVIRTGIGAPLSGDSHSMGREMKQAIEMAVEDANSFGRGSGVTFEARATDDESDPSRAERIAHEFCGDSKVLGVIGHYNSDASIAAASIYRNCDLPMITPIASNPELSERGFSNVFRFTDRDDRTSASIADFLYRVRGKRRAIVVESRSAYGQSMGHWFVTAFHHEGGATVGRHTVDVGARDFSRLIHELPTDFDVLFYGGTFEGAYILKSMRASGLDQLFAAGDGCWDTRNFLQPAGVSATQGEGVLVLAATPAVGYVPQSIIFAERYRNRFGPITNYAVNSYDSAAAMIEAIKAATASAGRLPERAEVLRSMRALRHEGIAYRKITTWDAKGDNQAAVTALYRAVNQSFEQVAVIE